MRSFDGGDEWGAASSFLGTGGVLLGRSDREGNRGV